MKTAVVYARYSCDRQNEQSIDGQLRVCNDYADKNDIIILDTYIDKAMSGTNDDRAAFQKMLRDSDKQSWDYVLVYKLDRFSRNKYEMALHRKHLKDNNTKLVSVMENIPEGPEGILLESLLEGMNQYYSEELSQKTKRGMNETRLKGNFIGGNVNFGYERDGPKLKINPDEAEILKKIFTDFANGVKVSEIVKSLNNQGIKNKNNIFLDSSVRSFLSQEKYTGIYKVNGQTYDKIYPKIIEPELYETVRKKLDANRYGCKKREHVVFLLKNKIQCGYCKSKMTSISAISSNNTSLRYYKCSKKNDNHCTCHHIPKDFVENCVNKVIIKLFNTPINISKFADKVLANHLRRSAEDNSLNLLKNDLAITNKSIANIISAIEKGIITDSTKSRLEQLDLEKKELEEKIIIAQSKQRQQLTKEQIIKFFSHSLKQCPEQMFNLLVNMVYIYDDKIEIQFNYTKNDSPNGEPQRIEVMTETWTTKRKYKSGTTKKLEQKYKLCVIL